MRSRIVLLWVVLCLVVEGSTVVFAAAAPPGEPQATTPTAMQLEPTATCPQDGINELNAVIAFVRGQSWADRPGSNPLTIAPDLIVCRVVLHVGELSAEEEAALLAGAGSRLAIEYRRDWAEPSRLFLILWIVFGGGGVVWVYRRFGRR